jgi:hypothetical protein
MLLAHFNDLSGHLLSYLLKSRNLFAKVCSEPSVGGIIGPLSLQDGREKLSHHLFGQDDKWSEDFSMGSELNMVNIKTVLEGGKRVCHCAIRGSTGRSSGEELRRLLETLSDLSYVLIAPNRLPVIHDLSSILPYDFVMRPHSSGAVSCGGRNPGSQPLP